MSHSLDRLTVLLVLVLLCAGAAEPAEVEAMLLLVTTLQATTPCQLVEADQ